MKSKRIIINADDFGWSESVTDGILKAHCEGVVTSTSLLANMPAAETAVRKLAAAPRLGVGVHLNASQGPPLSSAGLALLADSDGRMRRSALEVLLACAARPSVLRALEAEFDAQIRWTLDHGIRPTHLDTHRHAHGYPPIFRRVAALAMRYAIPFVRRYGEHLPGRGWPASSVKQRSVARVLNALGARNAARWPTLHAAQAAWGMAHTGRIDVRWLTLAAERAEPGVTEIVTHPGFAAGVPPSETRLVASREAELAALCHPDVRRAFSHPDIELVHYGRLW